MSQRYDPLITAACELSETDDEVFRVNASVYVTKKVLLEMSLSPENIADSMIPLIREHIRSLIEQKRRLVGDTVAGH